MSDEEDKIIDNIESTLKIDTESDLKEVIVHELLLKHRQEAIDLLAQYLCVKYTFKTIRYEKLSELWMYSQEVGIYEQHGVTFIDEFVEKMCCAGYTKHISNAVIDRVKARTYIYECDFVDKDVNLICVENGLLNIETKEVQPFSPEHYFFNKIKAVYNPEATCPKIMQFIKQVISEADINVIQEMLGYTLHRDYNINRAFLLNGVGRNGKTTLIQLIYHILGPDNCCAIGLQEICEDNFAWGDLKNKLVNISGDGSKGYLKDIEKFKKLVGGDPIDSNRKHAARVRFNNYAKMIFNTNDIPVSKDTSDGWFSKWIVIEFKSQFLENKVYDALSDSEKNSDKVFIANTDLLDELTTPEELSGLLNWMIDGLCRLKDQKSFSYSQSTNEVREHMMRKSDPYTAFVNEYIESDIENKVLKKELRVLFETYCRDNGIPPVFNDRRLRTALVSQYEIGDTTSHVGGLKHHFYVGICIKDSKKPVDDKKLEDKKPKVEGQSKLPLNSGNDKYSTGTPGSGGTPNIPYNTKKNIPPIGKSGVPPEPPEPQTHSTSIEPNLDFHSKPENQPKKEESDKEDKVVTDKTTKNDIEIIDSKEDNFLQDIEVKYEDIPISKIKETPEDIYFEAHDGVLDTIPKTYSEFMRRFPLCIENLRTIERIKYDPRVMDLLRFMADNMRTTEKQIDIFIEKGKREGDLYESSPGRINAL